MSIKKPLGLGLLIGLMAMAFAALPAFASAAELTDAGGSVAVGEEVSATSTNAETTITGGGLLVCSHVEIHGIVTQNSGGVVEVTGAGAAASTATGCTLNGEKTTVSPTLNEISLSGSTGTASFEFVVGGGARDTSVSTVSWTSPATSIHVQGPVSGAAPGEFHGDFTLSDALGEVTLD